VYAVAQPHTWLFLKERTPYTDSHFTMRSPMLNSVDEREMSLTKSCGLERFNVLPSNMSSTSLDTDHSDATSTSSDSETYSSSSLDFLVDLLDVTSVMWNDAPRPPILPSFSFFECYLFWWNRFLSTRPVSFSIFSFFSQTSRNLLTLISPENWLVRNITMMYHLISRKPLIVPLTWRDN